MHQPYNIYLVIENPWNLQEAIFLFIGSCYTISCYIKDLTLKLVIFSSPKEDINSHQITS